MNMALWLAAQPLMLASRSAARRTMLEAAGVSVELRPADIDERAVESAAGPVAPAAIAAVLARQKALAIAASHPGRLVLGADQTLAFGAERFSKPTDATAARGQLCALSGKAHELHSALAFVQNTQVLFEHVGTARLFMRVLSNRFLDLYLDAIGDAATKSVGAYQIEGLGAQLFARVDGDYFTILGLPLLPALDFLRRQGYLAS